MIEMIIKASILKAIVKYNKKVLCLVIAEIIIALMFRLYFFQSFVQRCEMYGYIFTILYSEINLLRSVLNSLNVGKSFEESSSIVSTPNEVLMLK